MFPNDIWDGTSESRLNPDDLKAPDALDWRRLVSEIQAIEQYILDFVGISFKAAKIAIEPNIYAAGETIGPTLDMGSDRLGYIYVNLNIPPYPPSLGDDTCRIEVKKGLIAPWEQFSFWNNSYFIQFLFGSNSSEWPIVPGWPGVDPIWPNGIFVPIPINLPYQFLRVRQNLPETASNNVLVITGRAPNLLIETIKSNNYTDSATGDIIDFGVSSITALTGVLIISSLVGTFTLEGLFEESHDKVTWTTILNSTTPTFTVNDSVITINFNRTRRYVRGKLVKVSGTITSCKVSIMIGANFPNSTSILTGQRGNRRRI